MKLVFVVLMEHGLFFMIWSYPTFTRFRAFFQPITKLNKHLSSSSFAIPIECSAVRRHPGMPSCAAQRMTRRASNADIYLLLAKGLQAAWAGLTTKGLGRESERRRNADRPRTRTQNAVIASSRLGFWLDLSQILPRWPDIYWRGCIASSLL